MMLTVTPVYSERGIAKYVSDYARLQRAGFHRDDAFSIAWLGLEDSLSGTHSGIADAALNIGPIHFDVQWYRKQRQANTLQQWQDLVALTDHLDILEKKEGDTSPYAPLLKKAGKACIALALFTAMVSVVQAQDMGSTSSFSLQNAQLPYTADTHEYIVRLVGIGDKITQVKSVDEAITLIQDDSTYAILLVSNPPTEENPAADFSDEQMRGITKFLEVVHSSNPSALAKLEPIIFRLQPGMWSAALKGRDNFKSVVSEYVGKPYTGQYYGDIMDLLVGSVTHIPTSDKEYNLFMSAIIEGRKADTESLDIIILGDDDVGVSRILYHELWHQLMENFSTEEVKQKFASALPTLDVTSYCGPYAKTQVEKVDAWARGKREELEGYISLCADQPLFEKTVRTLQETNTNTVLLDNIQRTKRALEDMGAEKLRERYDALLRNAVSECRWAEPIAEVGADVLSRDKRYTSSKMLVRRLMQDDDTVTLIRVNLAYDKLDEGQKFGIDQGLYTHDELIQFMPPLDDSYLLTDEEITEINSLLEDRAELERIATLRLGRKSLSPEKLMALQIRLSVQMKPLPTQHEVLEEFLESIK